MENLAYYDGEIGTVDQVKVPFLDRAHFFGDGVYEATMAAHGKPFLLEEHLDRFYSSATSFSIRIPFEKEQLRSLLLDLTSRVDGETHFVYWQVSRGVSMRNHVFDPDMKGKLWVLIRPQAIDPITDEGTVISTADKRFEYGNVKTLNLLPAVLYSQMAQDAHVSETVLHRDGIVTECAHSNISILKDGVFRSHPNDEHILRGIAKTHLILACYKLGIPVIERAFTLDELAHADEVIVSSSSKFALRIRELNGEPVGGHDEATLRRIQHAVADEFEAYTGYSVAGTL